MLKTYIFYFLLIIVFATGACNKRHTSREQTIPFEELKILPADQLYLDLGAVQRKKKADEADRLFSRLQKVTGFNGVVLYAEQGQLIYHKAFGYEDPWRKKRPLDLQSRFELASVSKMFTATAILILREQSRLSLDVDIRMYIPEWPYEGITIRQLLTHRSGLSRYESLADKYWPDKRVPLTNEAMIRLFIEHQPSPYFKPNNGFHYCNTNYALLASIVERVSGKTFPEYMKEAVFVPAGMQDAVIYQIDTTHRLSGYVEDAVPGYDSRGRRLVRVANDYLNGVMGDKVMLATAADLFNYELALKSGKLLSLASLEEAYSPGSPKHRRRRDNYGFGWRIRSEADSAIYHYGWWKGFRTFFIRDLAQQKTLIVLSNKAKGPGSEHFWNFINNQDFDLPEASVNPWMLPQTEDFKAQDAKK
jgi:CubicO group peptidase (beta-lactamase class C family)